MHEKVALLVSMGLFYAAAVELREAGIPFGRAYRIIFKRNPR